jgi:osmotically-inducible protein OsmY
MDPRNFFSIVLALAGVSALAAYRASRSFPEAQAASLPTGLGSPSAANAKLENAVKSMFASDERVRRAKLSVRADVTKNEVTLSGTVDSEAVRSRAVELAKTAHIGVVVNDKMTVKPRGSNTAR